MKFYEVIFLSVIIGLFCSFLSGYVVQIRKLNSYIEKLNGKVMSLDFISESFRNVCAGKGFKSFDEWEDTCRVLWNLESIERFRFMRDILTMIRTVFAVLGREFV